MADIVETAFAEGLDQAARLGRAGQVGAFVGGEDAVGADMVRYRLREPQIQARDQKHLAPVPSNRGDPRQHHRLIRQGGRIDLDGLGQALLERGPVGQQSDQQARRRQRPAAEVGEDRLHQQIRAHKGAIDIDHEGWGARRGPRLGRRRSARLRRQSHDGRRAIFGRSSRHAQAATTTINWP